jgi:hypothetical protein
LEKYEDSFEFRNWDEAEPKDLGRLLQKYMPHILHFSGHASNDHGNLIFLNSYDEGEIVPTVY